MRLLVPPEEALHLAHTIVIVVRRASLGGPDDGDRLEQRPRLSWEITRCSQCPRMGEQELATVVRWRGLREQPQCSAVPSRSASWREPRCCLTRFSEDRDGAKIALARRPIDVVSARRRVAPRVARAAAHRSWAPTRHAAAAVSYTARRTSGWRKRKRRGRSVVRTRSSRRRSSTASIAAARTLQPRPQPARARTDRPPRRLLPTHGARPRTGGRAPPAVTRRRLRAPQSQWLDGGNLGAIGPARSSDLASCSR